MRHSGETGCGIIRHPGQRRRDDELRHSLQRAGSFTLFLRVKDVQKGKAIIKKSLDTEASSDNIIFDRRVGQK
jgi:hypothetical protein